MKHLIDPSFVTATEMATVIGVDEKRVRRGYINNPEKQELSTVIAYGLYIKKNNISHNDLLKLVEIQNIIKKPVND